MLPGIPNPQCSGKSFKFIVLQEENCVLVKMGVDLIRRLCAQWPLGVVMLLRTSAQGQVVILANLDGRPTRVLGNRSNGISLILIRLI